MEFTEFDFHGPVIDFHAHLRPTLESKVELLAKMRQLGISHSIVVAGGVLPPQGLVGQPVNAAVPNKEVLVLCEESEGRLLPFYFANPHVGAQEYEAIGHRFYGLKLGPVVHGIPLTDVRNEAFLVVAKNFHHPVYLHCLPKTGFDVPALLQLAKNFPTVSFVLGHAGIGNCDFNAVDLIEPFSNISFETSGGFSSVIDYAVRELGMDRILFGSEYPLQAHELELAKMNVLRLDPKHLNGNASKLVRGLCA